MAEQFPDRVVSLSCGHVSHVPGEAARIGVLTVCLRCSLLRDIVEVKKAAIPVGL